MMYFYAVSGLTTEGATDSTKTGITEIGTTEHITTGISTTKGIVHFRAIIGMFYCFVVCTIKYTFLYLQSHLFGFMRMQFLNQQQ